MNGTRAQGLTEQYAEQRRGDVKYRLESCEKIGLGFVLRTDVSQLPLPKTGCNRLKESSMKLL